MRAQGGLVVVLFAAVSVGCVSKRDPTTTQAQSEPILTASSSAVDSVAAEVVKRLNKRDGAGIYALFGDQMRAKFPEVTTRRFVSDVTGGTGRIVSFETESRDGKDRARYHLHGERSDERLELAVDHDGRIAMLAITPAPPERPVARSTIPLVLPFRGQWYVGWGGSTPGDNQHVGHGSQQRAVDLAIRGPDARTFRGDGKRNEDYIAYGADVLAVADGTVTTVVDGVADNVPNALNRHAIFGNYVTIRHSDSLYSLYAHLLPGKMRVQVGASVKAGAVIGACGNSGDSSEPHLHLQLQDGPRPEDSWGVEAVFAGVLVTREGKGEWTAQYAFQKGDLVGEAADAATSLTPAP
jgi:hypothetical protein